MPNETNQGDELNITITEDESSVDSQDTKSEPENGDLDLDTNTNTEDTSVAKLTPAEISAKNQEEAWFKNVIDGKKNIEDAPKWLQNRLNKRFEALNKEPDIEDVVDKKLAARLEEQTFQELKSALPAMDAKTAKAFSQKFAELKPLGKVKALELTKQLLGITSDEKKSARAKMTLPPSGQPKAKVSDDPVDIAKDPVRWKQFVKEQDALGASIEIR